MMENIFKVDLQDGLENPVYKTIIVKAETLHQVSEFLERDFKKYGVLGISLAGTVNYDLLGESQLSINKEQARMLDYAQKLRNEAQHSRNRHRDQLKSIIKIIRDEKFSNAIIEKIIDEEPFLKQFNNLENDSNDKKR